MCLKTHRADVQVVHAGHLQPLTEEMFLHTGLCLEDGQRDGSDGERHANQSVSHSKLLLLETLQSAGSPQTFNSGKATLTSFYLVPVSIRKYHIYYHDTRGYQEGMEIRLTCNKVT